MAVDTSFLRFVVAYEVPEIRVGSLRYGELEDTLGGGCMEWALTTRNDLPPEVLCTIAVEDSEPGAGYLVENTGDGETVAHEMGRRPVTELVDPSLDDELWRGWIVRPDDTSSRMQALTLRAADVFQMRHMISAEIPSVYVWERDGGIWLSLVPSESGAGTEHVGQDVWMDGRTFSVDPGQSCRFEWAGWRWILHVNGHALVEDAIRVGDAEQRASSPEWWT